MFQVSNDFCFFQYAEVVSTKNVIFIILLEIEYKSELVFFD